MTETWKSITEPEAARLTLVFQWTPKVDVEPTDFTDNLLDACNYKILITIQGKFVTTPAYLDSSNWTGQEFFRLFSVIITGQASFFNLN